MLEEPPRGSAARSWVWVVLLTVVLYFGIFAARDIQRFVYDHFGRMTFLAAVFVAFGVATGAVVRQAARRWSSLAALVLVGALYAYGAWRLRRDPEEALHYVEYGALGFLIFRAYSHRLRDPLIYVAAACLAGILGTLDEVIQFVAPRRFFDFRDMSINVAAAFLMQIGIAAVLRPPFIRPPVSARSVRTVAKLVFVWALLLSLCFLDAYARQLRLMRGLGLPVPAMGFDEVMVEYGHAHVAPDGSRFYSRLTLDETRRMDRDLAAETAALLDRYQGTNGYARFHLEISRADYPLAYEARIHLFRRDKYAREAVSLRHRPETARYAATIAFRENELVEWLYPNTLARSRYVLRADWREIIYGLAAQESPYESPVSQGLFTRFTERQIQSLLAVAMLLAAAVWSTSTLRVIHAKGQTLR